MGFVQNTKIRVGRVKVTERVTSDPDHRGRRVLLAQEGEQLSAEEAFRRGIDADLLEGVGPSADVVMDAYRKAQADTDAAPEVLAEGRQAALQAERDANQASDGRRAARIRGDYPQDRGGGTWLLSDGTTVTGDQEAAEEAEAALHAEEETEAGDGGGDETPADPLADIKGVSDELATAIRAHVDGVDEVTVETLVAVDGVGKKTAEKVLAVLDGS